MSTNYKGLLQEHCAKNNIQLPTYKTIYKSGPSHEPLFESTCNCNGLTFTASAKNKKIAEAESAEKTYLAIINSPVVALPVIQPLSIKGYVSPPVINMDSSTVVKQKTISDVNEINFFEYKYVVMVDAENLDFDMKCIKDFNNVVVLFFVAKNTTKKIIFKYELEYKDCHVIVSDSIAKDAADHLLSFTLGRLQEINKAFIDIIYFVYTRDHYGQLLEKFAKNCKFICSSDELFKIIN